MRWGVQFEGYFEVNEVKGMGGCYINHVKIHPFPSPSFRTALSKPRNLSYFPLKIRSRPKKGENRPRLRTERFDSWVSKIARLREDTTQNTTTNFCSQPPRYRMSSVMLSCRRSALRVSGSRCSSISRENPRATAGSAVTCFGSHVASVWPWSRCQAKVKK